MDQGGEGKSVIGLACFLSGLSIGQYFNGVSFDLQDREDEG